MKVVFVSNYLSPHQLPFSLEMTGKCEYYFCATTPFNKQRLSVGYEDLNHKYAWVIPAYLSDEDKKTAKKVIDEADAVIFGSAPEEYIENRLKNGKVVFRYTERLYKTYTCPLKFPLRTIKFKKLYYNYKNQYLLCASAYTAYDFSRSRAFLNRTYKWGYFPKTKDCDLGRLTDGKDSGSILWVGRLIGWKHPEYAVMLAKRLKEDGYKNTITIVGAGEVEESLKSVARAFNLDNVMFLGGISNEEARRLMERSEIFLFTSDKREGWGAVVNEAMNAHCAVVASASCGSVPFMIKDGENGLIFESENFNDFYKKVRYLIDNPKKRKELSYNAYVTVKEEWNEKIAAERLLTLINEVLSGNDNPDVYESGVCSKAEIIKDNWYKKTK